MKFNTTFKELKEFIMKYWLQLLGCTTFIIMLVGIVSAACSNLETKIPTDKEIEWYESQILIQENKKENAHKMAEAARALGYGDLHQIIEIAKQEWVMADENVQNLNKTLEELKRTQNETKNKQEAEYPTATYIWYFLNDYGYNDYVKAGVLGNMMAEAGGQTLNIQVDAYSPGYYGICQWSLYYNPTLENASLETQVRYLISSMEYEFNTFGKNYKKGFKYSDFLKLDDEKDAALAFAKSYERCTSASYNQRKKNAEKAYKYFVG